MGYRWFFSRAVTLINNSHLAMGHNLWLHFGVDEHPFATYFDVDQEGFDPQPFGWDMCCLSQRLSGFAVHALWGGSQVESANGSDSPVALGGFLACPHIGSDILSSIPVQSCTARRPSDSSTA